MPALFSRLAARRSKHPATHLVMAMHEVAHVARMRFGGGRHEPCDGGGGVFVEILSFGLSRSSKHRIRQLIRQILTTERVIS